MSEEIKRIAIATGGGDAPGLNAVIHGAVYAARGLGWEIFGIRDGYEGLLDPDGYAGRGLVELRRSRVREISHLGGTILGTTNRGNPFRRVVSSANGSTVETDCSDALVKRFRDAGFDALIAVAATEVSRSHTNCSKKVCEWLEYLKRSTMTLNRRR